jgi:hypothetical protein
MSHIAGKSACPSSCYCTDHSQLRQTLSLIKWGWLLSLF